MDKKIFNPMKRKHEIVRYGKRYGYWWKKHREIYRNIKDFSPAINYTWDMPFELDEPMSYKHMDRWMKTEKYKNMNKVLCE